MKDIINIMMVLVILICFFVGIIFFKDSDHDKRESLKVIEKAGFEHDCDNVKVLFKKKKFYKLDVCGKIRKYQYNFDSDSFEDITKQLSD